MKNKNGRIDYRFKNIPIAFVAIIFNVKLIIYFYNTI
jgi:hypothetical protein